MSLINSDPALPVSSQLDGTMIVIPVIEESLQVAKQVVETGKVRLLKTVETYDETVTTALTREQFDVERVTIDRYVDQAPGPRQEGDTMIYPVLTEVAVVMKRLLLVEEIRVTKRLIQTDDIQTVSVRRESVTVERDAPPSERPVQ